MDSGGLSPPANPFNLRDYNDEIQTYLTCLEGNFVFTSTTLYTENVQKVEDTTNQQVQQADQKVTQLTADARRVQFEADSLALARDVAQISQIHKETVKTEQAARQEKIVHLRGQNVIGASIVAEFMSQNMSVHGSNPRDLIATVERVWG